MPLKVKLRTKNSFHNEIKSEGEIAELQRDEPRQPIVENQDEIQHSMAKSMSESQNKMGKKKNVFGKTFARMQMIEHLNRISGVPKTMTFN